MDSTIEAFAFPTGGTPGPVTNGSYTFGSLPALQPASFADADGNGLSDTWEKATGLTDPNADKDGDGFSNLQEQAAGTDPCDATSVPTGLIDPGQPTLEIIALTPTTATLRLSGKPGVLHRIEQSSDPSSLPGWAAYGDSITLPAHGQYDFTIPLNSGSRQFYRAVANP
jgi:hypothetical protein